MKWNWEKVFFLLFFSYLPDPIYTDIQTDFILDNLDHPPLTLVSLFEKFSFQVSSFHQMDEFYQSKNKKLDHLSLSLSLLMFRSFLLFVHHSFKIWTGFRWFFKQKRKKNHNLKDLSDMIMSIKSNPNQINVERNFKNIQFFQKNKNQRLSLTLIFMSNRKWWHKNLFITLFFWNFSFH